MRREAEIASKLDHPGICVVYDSGSDDGQHWIAMRFVAGSTLSETLRSEYAVPSDTAINRTLKLIEQTARALHAAHEVGIIHRDVKPGNVMVTADDRPVLLDFGLARDDESEGPTLTASDAVMGTPSYMSPEQLRRSRLPLDRRTDVWSLGVTLYQLLTAELPFSGATFAACAHQILNDPVVDPARINPAISKDLSTVVRFALQKEPVDRYATAEGLADDLRRLQEGRPVAIRPISRMKQLKRWAGRNRSMAALSSALAAALLATTVASVLAYLSARETADVESRRAAAEARRAASESRRLRVVGQTADRKRIEDLISEASHLFPISPELVTPVDAWLARAEALSEKRADHEGALEELASSRGDRAELDDDARAVIERLLRDLMRRYGDLDTTIVAVKRRRLVAESLAEISITRHQESWDRCISALQSSASYGDEVNDLEPQLGLVPLGPNRQGLWEFWHVTSGDRPQRDGTDGWLMSSATGVVLVLVPGTAAFNIGQDAPANVDIKAALERGYPNRAERKRRADRVALKPFFISKYEITQGQWMRLSEGPNPSHYKPGVRTVLQTEDKELTTLVHPVESITHIECTSVLPRHGLALPTEVQWEYACRAGGISYWHCGWEPGDVAGFGNVMGTEVDRSYRERANPGLTRDGWVVSAPVGRFRPNGFGLHDMIGNVGEWCADRYEEYAQGEVRPGDGLRTTTGGTVSHVFRGGSFLFGVNDCRSGRRLTLPPKSRSVDVGIRPTRPLK